MSTSYQNSVYKLKNLIYHNSVIRQQIYSKMNRNTIIIVLAIEATTTFTIMIMRSAMTIEFASAVHDDRWTTIEVSIDNANVSRGYELSVGIPKAHSSLSITQDYIVGEETQYYNYEFEFEDIPAGTPFEVCVKL